MEQNIKRIDATFSVSGQLAPSDLQALPALGFRSVVCNRPDHEGGPEQPEHGAMQQAAEALGLRFAYLPVQTTGATAEQAQQPTRLLTINPAVSNLRRCLVTMALLRSR